MSIVTRGQRKSWKASTRAMSRYRDQARRTMVEGRARAGAAAGALAGRRPPVKRTAAAGAAIGVLAGAAVTAGTAWLLRRKPKDTTSTDATTGHQPPAATDPATVRLNGTAPAARRDDVFAAFRP